MNKRIFYSKLAPYYDFFAPPTAEQECRFLNEVFQKFGDGKIVEILDLGCGTGRHSCILSKMGFQVTGIDLSNEMLNVARSKCPETRFIKGDFLKMPFASSIFDAAICMWTTIGYILDEKNFKIFVKNIYLVTKKLLILDSTNYENPSKGKNREEDSREFNLPDLTIKCTYVRNFDKKTRIREEVYHYKLFFEDGTRKEFVDKNRLRMWQLSEITKLLSPGFKILEVFGTYSLADKFLKSSDRKIVVAVKV